MKKFAYYYIQFLLFTYRIKSKIKFYESYDKTDILHYYLELSYNSKILSANQKCVLQKYGKKGEEINRKLRSNSIISSMDKALVEDLDSALKFLPSVNYIVFRKLDSNIFEKSIKYFERAYLSTSTNFMATTGSKKYTLVILVPVSESIKCLYIQEETKCGEDELLIQRNTCLNKLYEFCYKGIVYQICRISNIENQLK